MFLKNRAGRIVLDIILLVIFTLIFNFYLREVAFPSYMWIRFLILVAFAAIIIAFRLWLLKKEDIISVIVVFAVILSPVVIINMNRRINTIREYERVIRMNPNIVLEKSTDNIVADFKIEVSSIDEIIKHDSFYPEKITIIYYDKNENVVLRYSTSRVRLAEFLSIMGLDYDEKACKNDFTGTRTTVTLNNDIKKKILDQINMKIQREKKS